MSRPRYRGAAVATTISLALSVTTPVLAVAPAGVPEPPLVPGGFSSYVDAEGAHIVGFHLAENFGSRMIDVEVEFTWWAGGEIIGRAEVPIYLDAIVGSTRTPFHLIVNDGFAGADRVDFGWDSDHVRDLVPVGGLELSPPTTDGRSVSGTVENDDELDAEAIVIYALFRNDAGKVVETAASPPLDTLPGGASISYSFAGNPAAEAGTTVEVWAETTAGPYMTNWENFFADLGYISGDYPVLWLAQQRIVTGCNGGNFCSNRGVTRAQMAEFVDRATDPPDTSTDFFDDDDGHYAEDAINRLAAAGFVDGCGERAYCPTGRVNRGQMAKFITLAYDVPPSDIDAFTDDELSTTERYHDALAAAGISNGCNRFLGKYCPARQLTRVELAWILYRAEHLVLP